ncbi:unnamed protein product [Dicrocoelium dendriticum]|nr:unnamed protein product [Dicrocoelium dendriticum]
MNVLDIMYLMQERTKEPLSTVISRTRHSWLSRVTHARTQNSATWVVCTPEIWLEEEGRPSNDSVVLGTEGE